MAIMSVNKRSPVVLGLPAVLDFVVELGFLAPMAIGTFLILFPVFEGNSAETSGFFRVFSERSLVVMPDNPSPCPSPTALTGITNGMEIRIFRERSNLSRNTNRGLTVTIRQCQYYSCQ